MNRVLPLVILSSLCLAQKPAPVQLELMTYPEVYSAIHEQGKTTVLIFNGGTEQRGPHAVLGGHTFIARSVADEIARKLGNALVAPVLPFSPTDAFVKPQWPGTISVSTELYTKMNEAVVADMVVAGFKNIVLMGDHGGGQKQLEELADSLNAKYSPEGVHVLYCGAAYTKARDDFRPLRRMANPCFYVVSDQKKHSQLFLGEDPGRWAQTTYVQRS